MSEAEIVSEPHTELAAIPATVARLRSAFESGRTRPLAWRKQQLEQIIRMHEDHKQEFLDALHADLGKPAFEAFASDVGQGLSEAKSALKKLVKWTRPERVGGIPLMGRGRIIREPLGVVLIISPWNYPIGLLL